MEYILIYYLNHISLTSQPILVFLGLFESAIKGHYAHIHRADRIDPIRGCIYKL